MSRLIKALQKAHKEQENLNVSSGTVKTQQVNPALEYDHAHGHVKARPIDLQTILLVVLIILVAAGIYMNYNISVNLTSTKSDMEAISSHIQAQEDKFENMHRLIAHIETVNSGQNLQFLRKIDDLSASVSSQISDVQELSKSHYSELSKTIEEQERSISFLTEKYVQLERSVSNYSDVNNRYVEQLNALKKNIAQMNEAQTQQ